MNRFSCDTNCCYHWGRCCGRGNNHFLLRYQVHGCYKGRFNNKVSKGTSLKFILVIYMWLDFKIILRDTPLCMKCCFVISSHDFLDRLNRGLLLTDILLSQGFLNWSHCFESSTGANMTCITFTEYLRSKWPPMFRSSYS
jgi:hypothetical protein